MSEEETYTPKPLQTGLVLFVREDRQVCPIADVKNIVTPLGITVVVLDSQHGQLGPDDAVLVRWQDDEFTELYVDGDLPSG